MGISVSVDREACVGYGNCVVAAPEIFELDTDANMAIVLDGAPVDEHGDGISEAEIDCPARAILVTRGA
jgi:ferredoxin